MKRAAATARQALIRRGNQLRWVGIGLGVLAPLLAVGYLTLSWREMEQEALARQGLYSRVLEGQAHHTIDSVAANVRSTGDTLESPVGDIDPVHATRLLVDAIAAQPTLRSLSLLDARGMVLASTGIDNVARLVDPALLGGFPEDRRERLGPWLPVRDLAQLGEAGPRPSGLAAIPLVRLIVRGDQSPLMLVALMNPDRFATQHEVMIGSAAAQSALFTFGGQLLSGGSRIALEPGRSYERLAPFARFLPGREHASYVATGMDGEPAIGAFRTLRNWPLVVVSEQPYAEIWSELRERVGWAALATVLAWLALGAIMVVLRRGIDQAVAAQKLVAALHEDVARSEERWKLALEGAGDGVWDWDIATGAAHYSSRCRAMLGYAEADIGNYYERWTELIHPVDLQRFHEDLDAHLSGRSTLLHSELRMRCKTGEWKWLLMRGTVSAQRDVEDRPIRLTGTMTDITERRAADAALAASQARQFAVLQSSMDAIVTFDHAARVLDFNPAAETMFGRSQEDVLGRPMHELIPAEPRSRYPAGAVRFVTADGTTMLNRRTEAVARRADGTPFTVELTIVPVVSGGEELFTATMRDITGRRRVERALRESEAGARATFEQAAVGVYQEDAHRRFLRVNQTLCNLLGYSNDELLSQGADRILHPDDLAQNLQDTRRLLAGDLANLAREQRYRRKDGRTIWIRLTASVAHDDTGRILYLIGIVEDIGAQRQAQQELLAARRRELEIGARIQQSLLVTAPSHELAGVWLSSYTHASQDIDGDFFEVIRPGEHCIDLIAGDVMGKGVNAALMGAAVKMQFSRSLVELMTAPAPVGRLPEPVEILSAVHRAMTPHLQALDAFVTLSYVRIDLRENSLRWVGCGHEEALLIRGDGPAIVLGNQQPPLGVLDDMQFIQDTLPVFRGDALFMHSDGLSDALLRNSERVGHRKLRETCERLVRSQPAPSAALHLMRRELLGEATLTDDVTMILARVCVDGPVRRRLELPASATAIARLRRFVDDETAAAGLAPTVAGLYAIAVVEAFTNVFRHGIGRVEDAPVEVFAERSDSQLVIELAYIGESFTPPGECTPTSFDDYPEGGFGLTIIRKACDVVEYGHRGGVNSVRLVRWLSGEEFANTSQVEATSALQ